MLLPLHGTLGPLASGRGAGAVSPLLTGLVGYWKLDESSGNAADSSGAGRTLTNVGTATYGAGKIGNGVNVQTGKRLNRASEAALQAAMNMAFSVWFKSATGGNVLTKDGTTREYALVLNAGGTSTFTFWELGGAAASVVTSGTGGADGNWHLAVVSVVNGKPYMSIDGGTLAASATTRTAPNTGTDAFTLGARSGGTSPLTGMVDETGFWSRTLDASDVALLWNSGNGLTHPF